MKNFDAKAVLAEKMERIFKDAGVRAEAQKILDKYGQEKSEQEPDRVRLAILKLSGADLECLKETMTHAKHDFRDVIAWAEFPNQLIAKALPDGPKKEKLMERDRAQYEKWLFEVEG